MVTDKKDLEIVYNLQWKNDSGHGDDKANLVGMCDIPATTLNWETFKSYLLKNSGTTGDDVKVSYISIDNKEFPIESQLDFQLALYSFRQRARNGEIITLKLDRISDNSRMGRIKRLRRSAEPRVEEVKQSTLPNKSTLPDKNEVPDWFVDYMKTFKKEITKEITTSVVSMMIAVKLQNSNHHSRKSKGEYSKRSRKNTKCTETNEKEVMKSLKLERKLDSKLEKLEKKTLKIKEKKLALNRTNDCDLNQTNFDSHQFVNSVGDETAIMDAYPIVHDGVPTPHLSTGELYEHVWDIVNSGEIQWTDNTELRYAWGSEAFKPIETIIPCPTLIPGERGKLSVYFEIPKKQGKYECYWHFYHNNRRFGHWLGCQIIVDPSPTSSIAGNCTERSVFSKTTTKSPKSYGINEDILLKMKSNLYNMPQIDGEKPLNMLLEQVNDKTMNKDIEDMNATLSGLQIEDSINISDDNSSSESDNQSIISIPSIDSTPSDEFVLIPMPQYYVDGDETKTIEEACAMQDIKLEKIDTNENDNNNNNSVEEKPKEEIEALPSNYAYIVINNEKVAVPKRFLRADFLETAEDAPGPHVKVVKSEKQENIENLVSSTDDLKDVKPSQSLHVSVEAPCNVSQTSEMVVDKDNSRLFVFPLNYPGFEVVYPSNSQQNSLQPEANKLAEDNYKSLTEQTAASAPSYVQQNILVEENVPVRTWSDSNSAYSHCGFNIKREHAHPLSVNKNGHKDSCSYNRPYIKRRSGFNHSSCKGLHCRQPFFTNSRQDNMSTSNKTSFANSERHSNTSPVHEDVPNNCNDRNTVHVFPGNFVSGAVNVASSAINTARSVLSMFSSPNKPNQVYWENGHWNSAEPESPRARALRVLWEMGFWDIEYNTTLLARYNDDLARVISELVE